MLPAEENTLTKLIESRQVKVKTSEDFTAPTVAVIGLGNISKRHRKNIKELFPESKIIAVSASGRRPAELIENADLVALSLAQAIALNPTFAIVASPATLHVEHACALMSAGIPTLIEKPITTTVAEGMALLQIEFETRTPAAVGYCLRYLPSARFVKKALESQMLGVIYTAHINIGQYLPNWRPGADYRESVSAQKELGGGVLLELSHELDYLQWLLGRQDVHYACLRTSRELCLDVDEVADLVLVSERGTVSVLHMDFLQKSACRRCTLIGSKARLDWDLLENSVTLYDERGGRVLYRDSEWDKNIMYVDMVRDFAALIQGKVNECIRIAEGFETVSLIDAVRTKAIQGIVQ